MKYPKKSLASYIIPFLLIVILIGSGIYILQNNLNLSDLRRVLQPPEVAKDEKVRIVFQEGDNELKTWNDDSWQQLESDAFLQPGDTVKTGTGATLVLRFYEQSEVRIDANSELKLIRMDKDAIAGNHLAIELLGGRIWGRIEEANTPDGDFIINSNQQIVQIAKATLIDMTSSPETTRLIAGAATLNIAEKSNGTRKPISRLEISSGQQLVVDQLTIDQLKAGEKDVIDRIDDSYRESEWYLWNLDKEERLGNLVEIVEAPKKELEPLAEGLVSITSHTANQKVAGSILLQGSYDNEAIASIWVNGQEATLGLEGDWEASVSLSEQSNTVEVTAQEVNADEKKLALSLSLDVDSTGPALGAVTQPVIDANGNGVLEGNTLELIGEVSEDAQKVCVTHNDADTPYCLQQFSAGDTSYRYLGAVSYGNVISGKNKYSITAYDELNNRSEKTVYLFKDTPKPSEKIDEPTTSTPDTSPPGAELSVPVIIEPDASEVFQTTSTPLTLSGTVDPASRSLLINGKKASYTPGSADFSVSVDLELGETLIKVQTVDSTGQKSKTAVLQVIYLEELEKEEL